MKVKQTNNSFITKNKELEVLSIEGLSHSFPKHFQESFCISLILKGTRCIKLGQNNIYIPTKHISIINPLEVHSSFFLQPNIYFQTLHLNPEKIETYYNNLTKFRNNPIFDPTVNTIFIDIINTIKTNNLDSISNMLNQLIGSLIKYTETKNITNDYTFNIPWQNVSNFINTNLKNSIKISDLSAIAGINKYNFAKQFKNTSSMSPIHYIIMKRIFEAKKEIDPFTNLSQLAYEYNFVDISHFSRHFKRFIGLSPKQYQKGLF